MTTTKNPCPKCGGIIIDATTRYAVRANKCVACGVYHECGSIRQSLDRQITGREPKYIGGKDE